MRKAKPPAAELSAAQQEIMDIIWQHGELSASEIREIVAERRPVARNTIRTLIERMQAKGWLVHRPVGRTFLYSAAIRRQDSVGHKIADFVDSVCDGSLESLVTAFIDYRGLTSAELKRIGKMLNDAKATSLSTDAAKQKSNNHTRKNEEQ